MSIYLPDMNCDRGAPMGRREYHQKPDNRTVLLARVRLDSGGYDPGGAYWGIGAPLYCAQDTESDYQEFVRAYSRQDAATILGITNLLKRRV